MLPLLSTPSGHNPYVLIADDSETDAELAQLAFCRVDLVREVVWVRDGEAALGLLLDATRQPPRLVLLDLNMPRVDGIEIVRRLRANEQTRCVPVVMMSASSHDHDVRRALAAGASSYVMKPVDFQHFTDQLDVLARYWLQVHRTPES